MAKTAKPSEPPKQAEDKAKKPPAPRDTDDDDYEDGDIATPKRDRYGNDDEPL
jgi:hypothetical protein